MSAEPDRTPRTAKGERTRAHLIAAARAVFERQGYAVTKMGDIAAEAGVSYGSVYTYFTTKRDVLDATLEQLVTDLQASISSIDDTDPAARLAHANHSYIRAYVSHPRLMMVMQEAAMSDQDFARVLSNLRRNHIKKVAQHIRRQQELGLARDDVSAEMAATALCAMVEGFARSWTSSPDPADPAGAQTVTQLWLRALGLSESTETDISQHLEAGNGVHV